MGDAIERLGALLRKAGAVVTFDPARDQSKPCFCCGENTLPRTLEVVGYWTRKVGNRGWPGDTIERPMCAACVVAHETVGRLDLALALLPHLTGDELRRVAEAMPRVAGEWQHRERWGRRTEEDRASRDVATWEHFENKHQAADSEEWDWTAARPVLARTWDADEVPIETWHETPRAAQAACDARLEAAGVRLCGEIVKEGGT